LRRPGIVTFHIKKTKLTKSLISKIKKAWDIWANAKQKDFFLQKKVLEASRHEERCRVIHKAFLCKDPPVERSKFARKGPADSLPEWLN